MISLIIPTNKTNSQYTNNLINNIREIYPDESYVEIILSEDDTVTMGINYNNAVGKSKGEKIILLHNDMVIKPGFVEQMDKDIVPGRITAYTRVEPPIYLDTYNGKVILDCGDNLDNFDYKKFLDFKIEDTTLTDGGAQMFFGCMKEDYLGIDGVTFELFCEDDDLHLRHNIAGFQQKVSSAHVYHFVSKTSRVGDYQKIEIQSNRNFIKKWGFRTSIYNVVYDKKIIINNDINNSLEDLNIWFNGGNDIIVEVDGNTFTQQDYIYIQQLNDIIKDTNKLGTYELGNLKITINDLTEKQNKLIRI
jgi:hypothetical protein